MIAHSRIFLNKRLKINLIIFWKKDIIPLVLTQITVVSTASIIILDQILVFLDKIQSEIQQ
jgi:hypothetical protein